MPPYVRKPSIVPIVEPEVLMDGDHTIEKCFDVTTRVLQIVFEVLVAQRVYLEGMILKPNMVLPGLDSPVQVDADKAAEETITCLLRCVPAAVPGIAFLSGGQSAEDASAHLNAMHVRYPDLPWALTFSFAAGRTAAGNGILERARRKRCPCPKITGSAY